MSNSYLFSLGNSTMGPIGYCARVVADTPEEAVEILRERLKEALGSYDDCMVWPAYGPHPRLGEEYVDVYFNPGAITVMSIEDWE